MSAHTPGPWIVATSCSWRRIVSEHPTAGGSVCEPVVQRDGHPDLYFRNGGEDGPDARLLTSAPVLLEALRMIAEQNPVDLALDPLWPKDIAKAAIARATGEVPR